MASKAKSSSFVPKNESQKVLATAMETRSVALAIGPAGTGKTHAAVGIAVALHKTKYIHRIVVCRPAVGAGESNGFLPGTLEEKLRPYMIPIYECIGKTAADVQSGGIPSYVELCTFEHMRGRTFDDAFIIIDEAQNATLTQIEMAMTRLGEGSKMIVCADPSQCDLPEGRSGLNEIVEMFMDNDEIPVVQFRETDNLRHPLVAMMTVAFAKHRESKKRKPTK